MAASSSASIEVLGIRHHGPGSARSVGAALDELDPTHVVVEGPPELDDVVAFVADPAMVPPVAALVYAVDDPRRASFYPLAAFSPEWVAIRWAFERGVPVTFADLPAVHALALDDEERAVRDTVATLAGVAGYDDPESWWEDAVEHRRHDDPLGRFAVLRDAVASFRETGEDDDHTRRREAAMRRVLRRVAGDVGADGRVAVVCGAFHAPVLVRDAWPTKASDDALLRGLAKVKVAATWSPWTTARLASASGYGAGVTSPGWYEHLFTTPDDTVVDWMVRAARCLRDEQHDASAASAVEAARLAEALAALRGRPHAGLPEVTDATRTVLCEGSALPLALIHDRLVVGQGLGAVPDEAPRVPLARDLATQQKRLRLRPSASATTVTLDLRQESQLARSVLFHRLRLLGVHWAVPAEVGRTTGTFKEVWQLEWRPELDVDLIAAGVHGTTVAAASAAKVAADAEGSDDLLVLAGLVEACLHADLPDALGGVLAVLARRTAQQHDAEVLMEAVEPLARTRRYGDVRGVDTGVLDEVLDVLVTRAALGLPTSVASLDDERAEVVRAALEATHRGVTLVATPHLVEVWHDALGAVAGQAGVHGSVQGRVVRLLLDVDRIGGEEVRDLLGRALSRASDPRQGAAWLDGFLAGDALLLVHDHQLLALIDDWVSTIPEDTFDDLLPLLRRTFGRFVAAERHQIGDAVRRGPSAEGDAGGTDESIDAERAAPAVAAVARLLGVEA